MAHNIINTAFSKHNALPRRSILFAVCFLAGFMALNIFSFNENNKRIELIETINRENLPGELSQVQQTLIQLHAVVDNPRLSVSEKKTSLEKSLTDIKAMLATLQTNQPSAIASSKMSSHVARIHAAMDAITRLESGIALSSPGVNEPFMMYFNNLSIDFYEINRIAQDFHKLKMDSILYELRSKERFLFGISLTFVVLGSVMVIFLLADLFRRGELLERANQAERLKNSFFAMMSHEIRTPINGILGTLTLLNATPLDEQQKHLTSVVHHSATSLLVIVNDVLDYSKIEAGKLELEYLNYNLKDLLESVFELIRPLAEEKKLEFTYHIQDSLPNSLTSDPARIRQILLNFLSNAIKFTDKGRVTLFVSKEAPSLSSCHTPMLRFEVVDTGMGISQESTSHLFREFSQVDGSYSRRFAGTGLGLSICRRLTDMMKGHIGVQSDVGKGSTFWFSIPLTVATQEVAATPHMIDANLFQHKATLLLAEDNPTNQMIAEAFLKHGGHCVDVVDNGRKAVEAVKSKTYDAVFMDIAMPEMDGLAATKAIRAMPDKKDLPIIAMTAHAMRGDREECLAAGMNDYIPKPLSRETLLRLVAMWTQPIQTALTIPVAAPSALGHIVSKVVETPEISEPHFNQILEDLGAEHLADFSKRFYDDLKSTSQKMLNAEQQKKWDVVKLHAHSLKSCTLNFGLQRMSQMASMIEQQCKTQPRPDPTLFEAWPDYIQSGIAALNERFKELNISPLT